MKRVRTDTTTVVFADPRTGWAAGGTSTTVEPNDIIFVRHPVTGRRIRMIITKVDHPGGWIATQAEQLIRAQAAW